MAHANRAPPRVPSTAVCYADLRETHYYDAASSSCTDCAEGSSPLSSIFFVFALFSVAVPRGTRALRARASSRQGTSRLKRCLQGSRRLSACYARFCIANKVRQTVSFLQIVTNVPGVYVIRNCHAT